MLGLMFPTACGVCGSGYGDKESLDSRGNAKPTHLAWNLCQDLQQPTHLRRSLVDLRTLRMALPQEARARGVGTNTSVVEWWRCPWCSDRMRRPAPGGKADVNSKALHHKPESMTFSSQMWNVLNCSSSCCFLGCFPPARISPSALKH